MSTYPYEHIFSLTHLATPAPASVENFQAKLKQSLFAKPSGAENTQFGAVLASKTTERETHKEQSVKRECNFGSLLGNI